MKRLLYFAAILLAIFACSKGGDDERNDNPTPSPDKPKDEITISKSLISFDEFADEESISFSATADWIAEIVNDRADGWLSVIPQSGTAGDASITIKSKGNDTPDERNASVRIKAGTASKTIAVEVTSNVDVAVEIPADTDWISENTTRATSTNTYYFDIQPNDDYDQRSAKIKFTEQLTFNIAENQNETACEGFIIFRSKDDRLSQTVLIRQKKSQPFGGSIDDWGDNGEDNGGDAE